MASERRRAKPDLSDWADPSWARKQRRAPRKPRPRLRLTALAGAVAAAMVLAGCFTPWLLVEAGEVERVRDGLRADIAGLERSPPRDVGEFGELFDEILEREEVSGLHVFWWARNVRAFRSREVSAEGADAEARRFDRGLLVLMTALGALAGMALMLVVYFVGQRFLRATSPMLILAAVEGLLAVGMAGIYEFFFTPLHEGLAPGPGLHLLLGGGALLVLVALFGVSRRNWWQVYVGGALTVGGLVLLGWWWLLGGLPF